MIRKLEQPIGVYLQIGDTRKCYATLIGVDDFTFDLVLTDLSVPIHAAFLSSMVLSHWYIIGTGQPLITYPPYLDIISKIEDEEYWEVNEAEEEEEEEDEAQELYDDLSDDDQTLVDFLMEDGGYNDLEDAIHIVRKGELIVYESKDVYIDEFVQQTFGELDSRKRSYIDDDQIWHDLECGGGMSELPDGRIILW